MYLQVISLVVLNIGMLSLNMWRLRIKQKQRKIFALSFARMVIKKSKWTHCWLHKEVWIMRKTNRIYLVTWSYPGGAWDVVRAYVDTKAQARKAAKDQFGSCIEIHDIELWES